MYLILESLLYEYPFGGFLKWGIPKTMGFNTKISKMSKFGRFGGTPHFRKSPFEAGLGCIGCIRLTVFLPIPAESSRYKWGYTHELNDISTVTKLTLTNYEMGVYQLNDMVSTIVKWGIKNNATLCPHHHHLRSVCVEDWDRPDPGLGCFIGSKKMVQISNPWYPKKNHGLYICLYWKIPKITGGTPMTNRKARPLGCTPLIQPPIHGKQGPVIVKSTTSTGAKHPGGRGTSHGL